MEPKEVYAARPWLKSYNEWIPADIQLLPEKSMAESFDEAATKWKDKVAIVFYGRKIPYGELKDQVDRLATALNDIGVRKGDTVAFFLLNSPQFVIAFYAALKVGAIVTPISPVYVSPEIRYQLEDSKAKHIVCLDILWDKVEKTGVKFRNVILTNIGEYLPASKRFLGTSIIKGLYRKMELPSTQLYEREGFHQFKDLLAKYPPTPPDVAFKPVEDIAALLYTGGTTGLPKGAMVTHYNFVSNNEQNKAFFGEVFKDGKEVWMGAGPFYHIGGLCTCVIWAPIRGYTIVIFANPDIDAILDATEIYRATAFYGVPSFWERLKDYDKTMRVDWKRMTIITGGDTLLEDTAEAWKKRTGTILYDSYALSECSPMVAATPYEKPKASSQGVPVPSTVVAIMQPDKDEFIPLGQIGEIVVSGPQVFRGYWNKPDETAEQMVEIDGETWFRTGDLAHMDEDGYLFFYDRKKDIIKYKGYQVYPRVVEEVVKSHPKVKEVGVVGVADPGVGAYIKAYVVLQTEARGKVSESEIIEWCEDKLTHYMIPKILEFRGEIPKTDIGKVSRRELREEDEED